MVMTGGRDKGDDDEAVKVMKMGSSRKRGEGDDDGKQYDEEGVMMMVHTSPQLNPHSLYPFSPP